MDTLTPAIRGPEGLRHREPGSTHACIQVTTTAATRFVDLTVRLETFVARAGVRSGLLNVQTLHTTTAIVVNEHEPLLLADFDDLLQALASAEARYRHDDPTVRTVNVVEGERRNGHAHCRALLLPTSVCLNVVDGRLALGQWQRVFFVELDGPRERLLSVLLWGEGAR
jgi:secondary thiamine-phosphate synthase enzyme